MDVVSPFFAAAGPFIELAKYLRDNKNEISKEKKADLNKFREDIYAAVDITAKHIEEHPNREPSYRLTIKWETLANELERLQLKGSFQNQKLFDELSSVFNTKSEYWKHPEKWTEDFKEAGITLSQVLGKAADIE